MHLQHLEISQHYGSQLLTKFCSCNPIVMVEHLSRLCPIYYIGNEQNEIIKLWLMDIKMSVAVRTEKQVLHWVIRDVKLDPIVTYLIADGDFCSCWCFIFCLCITTSPTVTGSWFMVIWRNIWDKIGVSLYIGNFSRCWGWNVSVAFLNLSFELPIYLYFIFKWT